MVADVSGIVNMLATQPGQNIAQLGATLNQAEEYVARRNQLAFEQRRAEVKDALDAKLREKQMQIADLELVEKQSSIIVPIAGKIALAKDPLVRQQLFEDSVPYLKKIGASDARIDAMRSNLPNTDYWVSTVAEGLAAKDYFKLLQGGEGVDPTEAYKKKMELVRAGVPVEQAEGIAYGTYRSVTDPTTGDVLITDLRRGGHSPVPKEEAAVVEGHLPPAGTGGAPSRGYGAGVRKIVSGDRVEQKLQDKVQELSRDVIRAKIPDAENILAPIEATMRETFEKGKDVPGFGATSAAPTWAISTEGKLLRQDVAKLFNVTLHDRSGAAVTVPELERLKEEFGQGLFNTDEQLYAAIKRYRVMLEDFKKSQFAGYDPKIVGRYQEQGGLKLMNIMGEEPPAEPSGKPSAPPQGAITEERIRQDAIKYKWSEEQTQEAIKKYVRK